MSDPGMTSEQRAAIAVHYATQNRVCLDAGAEGEICIACAEVADQIDAAVEVERQAAEERGRRRGVEEAAEVCAEKARNYALRAAGQRAHGDLEEAQFLEPVATAVRDAEAAIRALAPRAQASDGPPCATCRHEKFWHQWSSTEHAFYCSPVGSDYCGCKNYLAPRDSAPAGTCANFWHPGHGHEIHARREAVGNLSAPHADHVNDSGCLNWKPRDSGKEG